MNKPHVCMISYGFHPPWAEGCSVITRDLASTLTKYVNLSIISVERIDYSRVRRKRGKQTAKSIHQLEASNVFKSMRLRGKFVLLDQILTSAKIWSILKSIDSKNRIDIVHIYNVSHFIISALVRLLNRKVVVHVFGDSGLGDSISKKLVDAYICTSNLGYFNLVKKGISKKKIHLIPPIVDCDVYSPLPKKECRDQLNASTDSFIVTYVGNLFPERFPLSLIKELKNVLKMHANLELMLYAPYSLRNRENAMRLDKVLSQLGIKHRITVSNLSEIEKVRVYNASDVLIFPFIKELSGNVVIDPPLTILEGMACGKIVIASRTLSIPEVIQQGKNGFLVGPRDYKGFVSTLEYVMRNLSELGYIKRNAKETIQRGFSSEVAARMLMAVYQSVLD